MIAAAKDFKRIRKGDVFFRENSEAKKATAKNIAELHKKFNKIPLSKKFKILRDTVKIKIQDGKANSNNLNIFDCMVIPLSSESEKLIPELETQFDSNMYNQFLLSFSLPVSKHTTQNMYNIAMASILREKTIHQVETNKNLKILEVYQKTPNAIQSLLKAWRDEACNSESFNDYIEECKEKNIK